MSQSAALASPEQFESAQTQKAGGAFRTISEVAEELGVQQHVLRFWETKFSQIRPMKRGGGRRYYRPEDVQLLKHIHTLLYSEGYTIKGAQKLLKGQSRGSIASAANVAAETAEKAQVVANNTAPLKAATAVKTAAPVQSNDAQMPAAMVEALQGMLSDLKELRTMVVKAS